MSTAGPTVFVLLTGFCFEEGEDLSVFSTREKADRAAKAWIYSILRKKDLKKNMALVEEKWDDEVFVTNLVRDNGRRFEIYEMEVG
jgi:hypothetical protein